MGKNAASYKRALAEIKKDLQNKLMNGVTGPDEIAAMRRTIELMSHTLEKNSEGLESYYESLAPDKYNNTGAGRWKLDAINLAYDQLFPYDVSDAAYRLYKDSIDAYKDYWYRRVASLQFPYRSVDDKKRGISYLYREQPVIKDIYKLIVDEFNSWLDEYPIDTEFYTRKFYIYFSPEAIMGHFITERPDMAVWIRIAHSLPLDAERLDIPVDRPAIVETIELVVSVIPVIGNIVAAYEAYAGVDLFGYRLNDIERGILAASVLVPFAGRLIKSGRILYTESRLVALYGREAAEWSKAIRVSGATKASTVMILQKAEAMLLAQRKLDKDLAKEATAELTKLLKQIDTPPTHTVDQAVSDLLGQLGAKHKILGSLDLFALERVLLKGPNVDHLKGQLLEELIESRIVPWLRDKAGCYALGIKVRKEKLQFIPGHLIRSFDGRQITDGILAYNNNGVLEIVAIFEAKAGKSAARELSIKKGSISSLTAAERAELRAYAKDVWRDEFYEAKKTGQAYKKTVEDIEGEVILKERGGQVRRDIERLSQDANGNLAQIRIGAEATAVKARISPKFTKFFGILPKDVKTDLIEKELRESKFSFELIGADINQKDLKSISEKMVDLATSIANAP